GPDQELKWRPPPKYLEEASGTIRRPPPVVNADSHEHHANVSARRARTPSTPTQPHPRRRCPRPRGSDARRNYEKVLAAAREAFAEGGESTALEEIARRAGVGIGTLYRHFPNRQALIEALYVGEVEDICRSAAELDEADPWEALEEWFERFIGYMATKQ